MKMTGRIVGVLAGCLAIAGASAAQETAPPVVVELYTSQGCSSCPPADEIMARLASDPRVIALALHVDYWDYLGWKDKFADPRFSARQKAYAKAIRDRMVYTPQMIIQGQDRVVGSRGDEVEAAILQHLDRPSTIRMVLERGEGGRLTIRAEADPPPGKTLRVQLVRFRPAQDVTIKRGENSGRSLTYHNVVTSWQVLGDWSGEAPLVMEAEASGADPAVVIIQSEGPAEILAAQQLR